MIVTVIAAFVVGVLVGGAVVGVLLAPMVNKPKSRVCQHDTVLLHTVTFPRTGFGESTSIGTCLICGQEVRFSLGNVTETRRNQVREVVLRAQGYEPVPGHPAAKGTGDVWSRGGATD